MHKRCQRIESARRKRNRPSSEVPNINNVISMLGLGQSFICGAGPSKVGIRQVPRGSRMQSTIRIGRIASLFGYNRELRMNDYLE